MTLGSWSTNLKTGGFVFWSGNKKDSSPPCTPLFPSRHISFLWFAVVLEIQFWAINQFWLNLQTWLGMYTACKHGFFITGCSFFPTGSKRHLLILTLLRLYLPSRETSFRLWTLSSISKVLVTCYVNVNMFSFLQTSSNIFKSKASLWNILSIGKSVT